MVKQRNTDTGAVPVVTAFVWDGRRVLLSLRSERVSTFALHWAAVSGYLEGGDPAGWAAVEIEEETGINRQQLTLRNAGQPLDVADDAGGPGFIVHPFLFSVTSGTTVHRDWESRRLEWVDVHELMQERRSPAVPRLYDAFRRVWPPATGKQAIQIHSPQALDWLRQDRQSGAGTLARWAAREVVKLAEVCSPEEFADCRGLLCHATARMKDARPSMTPLENLLEDVLRVLEEAEGKREFLSRTDALISETWRAEERLAETVASRIAAGSTIMTVSYSSTVLRILQTASDRLKRVLVCEARPLYEGRRLAEELSRAGIAVTILTEAQVASLMPQVDLVLLGADSVVPGLGVINKSGSTLLALAAHHQRTPVMVAADRLKTVRSAAPACPVLESGQPGEVWDQAPDGVDVSNVYFEIVPESLITEVVQ
jgi:translation initiation factor eIF-2B subunit delta